jgi:hypothetical protein
MSDALNQEFLGIEILLNHYNVDFVRQGYSYVIPGFTLYYRGPQLGWHWSFGSFGSIYKN